MKFTASSPRQSLPTEMAAHYAGLKACLSRDFGVLQNLVSALRQVRTLSPQVTSEPLRLIWTSAGKSAGNAEQKTFGFAIRSKGMADVKGDFHEAEITVKHFSKCPISWAFYKISMKANVLKTMATASNYRLCGEGCGESRGTQKEVSNG
jgi:hypothetical protein